MNKFKPSVDRIIKNQDLIRKIKSPILDLPEFNTITGCVHQDRSKDKLIRRLKHLEKEEKQDERLADLYKSDRYLDEATKNLGKKFGKRANQI